LQRREKYSADNFARPFEQEKGGQIKENARNVTLARWGINKVKREDK
jgi:hypothetical protein